MGYAIGALIVATALAAWAVNAWMNFALTILERVMIRISDLHHGVDRRITVAPTVPLFLILILTPPLAVSGYIISIYLILAS